jgi:YfiH family protein
MLSWCGAAGLGPQRRRAALSGPRNGGDAATTGPDRPTWQWRHRHGVGFWSSPGLAAAGFLAAFSSRLGGVSPAPYATLNLGTGTGDDPGRVAENTRRFAGAAGFDAGALARVRQVHGARVVLAQGPGDLGEADGLVTARGGVGLGVLVADCLAVYLVDPVRRTAGLCHAGWRGTVADVAGATVRALAEAFGSRPTDVWALLSPGIGPCCYEVGPEVVEALRGAAPWAQAALAPPAAPPPPRPGTGARLDLPLANLLRLRDAGVPPEHVGLERLCTSCHPQVLFSHRRDRGRTGRMLAVLAV